MREGIFVLAQRTAGVFCVVRVVAGHLRGGQEGVAHANARTSPLKRPAERQAPAPAIDVEASYEQRCRTGGGRARPGTSCASRRVVSQLRDGAQQGGDPL